MLRKIVIGLLAIGTVGGFAAGFAGLAYRHHLQRGFWHQQGQAACAPQQAAAQPVVQQMVVPLPIIVMPAMAPPAAAVVTTAAPVAAPIPAP